ncbi:MAG: rab-GTPase-TBC domain-containing protein [Monoraphidium minutum]|nr:MAG: rab-GTPase-TBC domain-containing protein [Monoraphidium minutum]
MRPRHRSYRNGGGGGSGLVVASSVAYGVGGVALAAAAVGAVVAYATLTHTPRRRVGVSREQWVAAVAESGAVTGFDTLVHEIAQRGVEPELRSEAWPFLLGVFSPESTYEERRRQHALMVQQHQQLLLQCQGLEAALRDCVRGRDAAAAAGAGAEPGGGEGGAAAAGGGGGGGPPHELPAQVVQFAEAHRIIVIDAVRTDFRRASVAAIYSSAAADGGGGDDEGDGGGGGGGGRGGACTLFGAAPLADPTVLSWVSGWLGSHPGGVWGGGRRLWVSEAAQTVLDGSGHLGPEGRRQAARLVALLSAYAVFDPETGYCQGMSDLAMPLLVLLDDDALAFWCFAALMRTFGARANFAVDEAGMFSQLRGLGVALGRADRVLAHKLRVMGAGDCHFAYRMAVVLMRRDLPLGQAMTLWELLWADARRQLLQRRQRGAGARGVPPGLAPAGSVTASLDGGDGGGGGSDGDPKAALKRAQAAKEAARVAAAEGEDAGFLAAAFSELFVHFLASVAVGARRRVLDECAGPDDAMRLFHSLKSIDFWECVSRAHVLRAAGASRKHR